MPLSGSTRPGRITEMAISSRILRWHDSIKAAMVLVARVPAFPECAPATGNVLQQPPLLLRSYSVRVVSWRPKRTPIAWKLRVSVTIEMARRPPGGGLLIDFFDQPAFNKRRVILVTLAKQAGSARQSEYVRLAHAGQSGGKRPRWLFYEINITNLSLSA